LAGFNQAGAGQLTPGQARQNNSSTSASSHKLLLSLDFILNENKATNTLKAPEKM